MTFEASPLNIIALIFIIVGILKIFTISINKKNWMPVVRSFFSNKLAGSAVVIILAIIVFYFLIQELTIIQIIASAAFISLLIALSVLQFNEEIVALAKKISSKKFSLMTWIYIFIWLILFAWALYQMFV